MFHAYLAEYQPETLSKAGADTEQHTLQGQVQAHLVPFSPAEDGDGYARERNRHGERRLPVQRLAQQQPAGECGGGRGDGHEKLPEAGSDEKIAVEKAPVTEDVADKRREAQPEPGARVGIDRIRPADSDPKQYGKEENGHAEAQGVRDHGTHPVAFLVGEPRGDGPGDRYHQRDDLSQIWHRCLQGVRFP